MDFIDPPLSKNVISSLSSTMANLYRVIPISRSGDVLTVAASQVAEQSNLDVILDELNAFLGLKVESVRVADHLIDRALRHYYSDPAAVPTPNCIHIYPHPVYSRQSELLQLLTRVIDALGNADVKTASVCCTVDELVVIIRRHEGEEVLERFADGEFGQRMIDRLKLMANIDVSDRSTQSVVIELSFRSVDLRIRAAFSVQDEVQVIELSR